MRKYKIMSCVVLFITTLIVSTISYAELSSHSDAEETINIIELADNDNEGNLIKELEEPSINKTESLDENQNLSSDTEIIIEQATDTDAIPIDILEQSTMTDIQIETVDYSPYLEHLIAWQEITFYLFLAFALILLITIFSLRWLS